MRRVLLAVLLATSHTAHGAGEPFSGRWEIDLRSPTERKENAECGGAYFELTQTGDAIVGDHGMVTVGCGRQNEGGPESVKGLVVGNVAVLAVTSTRNGAVVLGRAFLKRGRLHWEYRELLRPGEPEGDSPLILGSAVLTPTAKLSR